MHEKKRRLRNPLDIGEKVLVLAGRLKKKKMHQEGYVKAQEKIDLFLTETEILL